MNLIVHGFGKYNFFGGCRVPLGCSGGTRPPPGWPGGLNGHYLPRPPWKYFWNPSKPSIVTLWRSPGHWLLWLSQKILIQLGRGVSRFAAGKNANSTNISKLKNKMRNNSSQKLKVWAHPLDLLCENQWKQVKLGFTRACHSIDKLGKKWLKTRQNWSFNWLKLHNLLKYCKMLILLNFLN